MNSSEGLTITSPLASRKRLLPKLLLAMVLLFLLAGAGVASCFWLSGDSRALRNSVVESLSPGAWDKTIEIGVGRITLGLVRAGLSFVDIEPEAQAALQTIRAAEVGVYRLRPDCRQPDHAAMLGAADTAMTQRGWDRVVGCVNRRELVAIYAPKEMGARQNLRLCVLVQAERDLVVVSAQGNLEPLVEMALNRPEWLEAKRAGIRF